MPFIIAVNKMYYQQQPDGVVLLTPNREKATRFDEATADTLAADHNKYTNGEDAVVEGAAQHTGEKQ